MSIFGFFRSSSTGTNELSEIFPLSISKIDFIRTDILTTYTKILTDTIERTQGIGKESTSLLFDNCVQNESNDGLITLLATAMTDQKDLFLVYKPSLKVIRRATSAEENKIKEDYKKNGQSDAGVYISFKNYRRTQMLNIYSGFEYCSLSSLNKTLNLSKAVQVKIKDLRSSVGLNDSAEAMAQGKSIAEALGKGSDVLLDVEDDITTAKPDTSAIEKSIAFLEAKKSFILGLPISYISGLQTPGIGSSGEADMRAVERGLKQYFVSVVSPAIKALFGSEVSFKSQDFRQIGTALEVLKTFDLVTDDNMSREAKKEIVARVFELDQDQEKKNLKREAKENDDTLSAKTNDSKSNEKENVKEISKQ